MLARKVQAVIRPEFHPTSRYSTPPKTIRLPPLPPLVLHDYPTVAASSGLVFENSLSVHSTFTWQ